MDTSNTRASTPEERRTREQNIATDLIQISLGTGFGALALHATGEFPKGGDLASKVYEYAPTAGAAVIVGHGIVKLVEHYRNK